MAKTALPKQKQEARGGQGSFALWQNGRDEASGELTEIKSLVGITYEQFLHEPQYGAFVAAFMFFV